MFVICSNIKNIILSGIRSKHVYLDINCYHIIITRLLLLIKLSKEGNMIKIMCILIFCSITLSFAQGPDTLWTRYYEAFTGSEDKGFAIHPTSDSGFIIAGYSRYYGTYIYLLRINLNGDTLWTRLYRHVGGDQNAIAYSVDLTFDGGYIVGCGHSNYFYGLHLLKLNSSGDSIWSKTHTVGLGPAYSVKQTNDGGFIVAGSNGQQGIMIKTDTFGNIVWYKNYNYTWENIFFSVTPTTDGGYLLGGYGWQNAHDLYIVKTNSLGDTLWTRIFGGPDGDVCHAVMETGDHYYIAVGGISEELSRMPGDVYVVKLDGNGNVIWEKSVGTPNDDVGLNVTETPDNCYLICGYTYNYDHGQYNYYLIKMNPGGDTLWTKSYSRGGDEWAHAVVVTPEGGYLMCGWGYHTNHEYDVFLIKTNSSGEVEENNLPFTQLCPLDAYPNPFQYRTKISIKYNGSTQSIDHLMIYNANGSLVKKIDLPINNPGTNQIIFWDGRDDSDRLLPNGVYFIKNTYGSPQTSFKLILLR